MCTVHKQYSNINQTRTRCLTVVPSACKSAVEALIHPWYWFVYDRSTMGLILWPFCSICGLRVTPIYKHYFDILNNLWWLNLWVNLPGLKDAQIAGKTLFGGVFLRVWKIPAFDPADREKRFIPHNYVRASSNPLRV